MKAPRRKFLRLAASAAALPVVPRIAWAQASAQGYPSRPVRFVVGFAPGGGGDLATRLMAQWLSERLGQQFVVENRVGASSNLATEQVVRAPPDGYTLIQLNVANAINASLYDKLSFNVLRDLAPVASFMRVPNVMEVSPTLPVNTVPEFIAYAKANPGQVLFASSGVGTTLHMSCRDRRLASPPDACRRLDVEETLAILAHLCHLLAHADACRRLIAPPPGYQVVTTDRGDLCRCAGFQRP